LLSLSESCHLSSLLFRRCLSPAVFLTSVTLLSLHQVLVKVFQTVLLDSADHDHLKAFYMIVPALCLSWTDAALQVRPI